MANICEDSQIQRDIEEEKKSAEALLEKRRSANRISMQRRRLEQRLFCTDPKLFLRNN